MDEEIPDNDPKMFVSSMFMAIMRPVFPPGLKSLLESFGAAFQEMKRDPYGISASEMAERISEFTDDSDLEFFILHRASAGESLRIYRACRLYLNYIMAMDSSSDAFRTETGHLTWQMSVLYICRRGLSLLPASDDEEDNGASGLGTDGRFRP